MFMKFSIQQINLQYFRTFAQYIIYFLFTKNYIIKFLEEILDDM